MAADIRRKTAGWHGHTRGIPDQHRGLPSGPSARPGVRGTHRAGWSARSYPRRRRNQARESGAGAM